VVLTFSNKTVNTRFIDVIILIQSRKLGNKERVLSRTLKGTIKKETSFNPVDKLNAPEKELCDHFHYDGVISKIMLEL